MLLLIFKRDNQPITENNKYELRIKKISAKGNKHFIDFITELTKESQKKQNYINVYKIGKASLQKIAFINKGQLNTL